MGSRNTTAEIKQWMLLQCSVNHEKLFLLMILPKNDASEWSDQEKNSCLVYQYLFICTVLSAPHLYNLKNAFRELPTQKKCRYQPQSLS